MTLKLTRIEKLILEIAKNLIKEKPLNIEDLFSTSISELIYPKNEISQAIYNLILKNYIIEGTKITKETIFENDRRYRIFQHICQNPGSHLRAIRRNLNVSPRLAAWHLKMLEDFNFIKKSRFMNKVVYFSSNINLNDFNRIITLKTPEIFKILEYILLNPGIIFIELIKKTGLSSKKLKYYIQRFHELNLINKDTNTGQIKYFTNLNDLLPILRTLKVSEQKLKKYEEISRSYQNKLEFKPTYIET